MTAQPATIQPAVQPQEWDWKAKLSTLTTSPTRLLGIGGTDLAAILGMDRYRTAWDVWARLKGAQGPDLDEVPAVRWGKLLEDPVAQEWANRHGVSVFPVPSLGHRDRHWQVGSPDRLVHHAPEGLEVKTAGARMAHLWGDPGTDEVPEPYLLQVAWYLSLLEVETWHLAALIGGQDFRPYVIHRDPELESYILDRAERFWRDHVLADVPPDVPTDHPEAARVLAARYPRHAARVFVDLGSAGNANATAYMEARARLDQAKADLEAAENALKAALGEAEGSQGDGWKLTWKTPKDSTRTDWESVARDLLASLAEAADHETAGAVFADSVQAYTVTKPGARRFLLRALEG